jgi:hypothetical protein
MKVDHPRPKRTPAAGAPAASAETATGQPAKKLPRLARRTQRRRTRGRLGSLILAAQRPSAAGSRRGNGYCHHHRFLPASFRVTGLALLQHTPTSRARSSGG